MLKSKTLWIIVGVVLLLGGYAGFRYRQSLKKGTLQFDTTTVDRGKIVAKVTASGSLSAIVTVQVGSQVSGRVQQLLVDFNSPVKKGQLIAKIDPQLFQASYEQAKANFLAAQANLAKAKFQAEDADRQFKRASSLAVRKLIAQADLDTAQATADAARAQVDASGSAVEQARANLHATEVNLAYTDIFSPSDGVVISRNVDVGQTVAASLQAPTLYVIAEDLRKMQVDTWVAEADIGKLAGGMPATFTVDAYPGERFRGTVRQIRNAPQTQQNVVTYDAVIDIDNSELKLKPGMTANVTFVYAQRDDVLRVPNAALRFRPTTEMLGSTGAGQPAATTGGAERPRGSGAGGPRGQKPANQSVWVLAQGKPQQVQVKGGVSDGSWTEILEGELHAGDRVITDVSGGSATSAQQGVPPGGFPRRMF